MLDRLAEDLFLEADVADVDARERIGRLLHQHLLKGGERAVVLLVQHLRPPEQRLRLRLAGRELQRLRERLDRPRGVAEHYKTKTLFDERRRADVVGVQHRPLSREFRSSGLLRVGCNLLVAIDELADVFFQLRQLAEHAVDLLEERDDFALRRFALGARPPAAAGRFELARDRIVFAPQRADRCFRRHDAPCKASFSFEFSSLFVFNTTIVRPSCTTSPAMYSAARPRTMPGGGVTACAGTCSTSVTVSTMTPIFPPSNSRITVRVSSRSAAAAPSRLRRSTSGTAPP